MTDQKKTKLALITGATGGIGTALCRAFSIAGIKVVVNYRSEEKLEKWRSEMSEEGFDNFHFVHGDVADYSSVEKMFDEIAGLGDLDILVNNAGITADSSFKKMSFEQWDRVIRSNLYSVFNCSKFAVDSMLKSGSGRIINISSVNGQKGQFGQVNYSASKAGIHGFTKSLAMELASKNITVNTISPGYTGTQMVRSIPEKILEKIVAQIPVGRLAEPQEIAELVLYLASDSAGFITGANYTINGGQHVY